MLNHLFYQKRSALWPPHSAGFLHWTSVRRTLQKLWLFCTVLFFTSNAYAEKALHTFNILLLQPEFVFEERVPDASAFSAYIKSIESSISAALQTKPRFAPVGGFVVVAVKPGQKSKVWLDFGPSLNRQNSVTIQTAVKSVSAVAVTGGVIVFAIKVGLWNSTESKAIAPSPAEWKAAAKKAGHPLKAGALVEGIWRD